MMYLKNRCIKYPECISVFTNRLVWLFLYSQTSAVRFWFGFASIGFSTFLLSSNKVVDVHSEYSLMLAIGALWVWGLGFAVHGLSVWYGIFTNTYNRLLVVLEGLLGVILWSASAVAVMIEQKSFGAHTVAAFVAFWLLVRYPTHREFHDAGRH